MTTNVIYEEHGSDWSHQVSAVGTTRWLQRDQILPLSCKLRVWLTRLHAWQVSSLKMTHDGVCWAWLARVLESDTRSNYLQEAIMQLGSKNLLIKNLNMCWPSSHWENNLQSSILTIPFWPWSQNSVLTYSCSWTHSFLLSLREG